MQETNVMKFLNEVSLEYPQATSFAAGQPNPEFYENENWWDFVKTFEKEKGNGHSASLLYQYSSSIGLINREIAEYLKIDEEINVSAGDIVLTNGCQEAINLVVLNEMQTENECAVVIEPSYVGFYQVLETLQKKLATIDYAQVQDGEDLCCLKLENELVKLQRKGLSIRLLYINPDFNNPLGYRLSLKSRNQLIDLASRFDFKLIEDNPYSRFCYDLERLPSIYSLDGAGVTYHLGSFSKILCPGLRVGYLVKPQSKAASNESISNLKSCISINTSAISQAIVGGFLIRNQYSMKQRMMFVNDEYRKRKEAMVNAIKKYISPLGGKLYSEVSGGFFQVIELPFEVKLSWIERAAKDASVIVMPVSFFCINSNKWNRHIRLSFSYYDEESIEKGVIRLANFISKTIPNKKID